MALTNRPHVVPMHLSRVQLALLAYTHCDVRLLLGILNPLSLQIEAVARVVKPHAEVARLGKQFLVNLH